MGSSTSKLNGEHHKLFLPSRDSPLKLLITPLTVFKKISTLLKIKIYLQFLSRIIIVFPKNGKALGPSNLKQITNDFK